LPEQNDFNIGEWLKAKGGSIAALYRFEKSQNECVGSRECVAAMKGVGCPGMVRGPHPTV